MDELENGWRDPGIFSSVCKFFQRFFRISKSAINFNLMHDFDPHSAASSSRASANRESNPAAKSFPAVQLYKNYNHPKLGTTVASENDHYFLDQASQNDFL